MKDKLNQFISNLNGQFVEVSSNSALYQCMDLAYNWIFALGIPKATIQHGAAYEIWSQATDLTRQYFDLIKEETSVIPQEGDLVVWSNKYGTYGHVAIVIEASQLTMKVFEQNNPIGSNAHIQDRKYTNVSGYLRPKNIAIDNVPQWLGTLLQERNLTIENESEIRILFEKSRKYDDEVKVLQEQVKSANEQLADKSLEVSNLTGKVESLSAKKEELEKLYNDAKSERDSFLWEKEKLEIQIDESNKKVEELQKGKETLEQENNALKIELNASQNISVSDIPKFELLFIAIKRLFGGE